MSEQIRIETRTKWSDDFFIEIGFRMQERFFKPGLFKKFVQGDFVFRFSQKTYILRVMDDKANLLINESPQNVKLDLAIYEEACWVKLYQKRINPLRLLLNGKIKIMSGGLKSFLLYKLCFTKPYSKTVDDMEKNIKKTPPLKEIKNVLVFNSTPRKDGATSIFLNYFIEGMKSAGVDVKVIFVYDKVIKTCTGCFYCWYVEPGKCKLQDDMSEIIQSIEDAHLIILAFPTYVGNIPSGLQKLLERCLPMLHHLFVQCDNGLSHHPRRRQKYQQYLVALNVFGLAESNQSSHLYKQLEDMCFAYSFNYLGMIRIRSALSKAINRQEEPFFHEDINALQIMGKELIIHKKIDYLASKKIGAKSALSVQDSKYVNSIIFDLLIEQQKTLRTTFRESKRYRTLIDAVVEDSRGKSIEAKIIDISLRGFLVTTPYASELDWKTQVKLSFDIMGGRLEKITVETRHIKTKGADSFVGLRILSYGNEAQEKKFNEFIQFHENLSLDV